VCVVPGQPSGLGHDSDGNLLVASMETRELLRFDGTSIEAVADLSPLVSGPANDLAIDGQNRCYVGNFGLVGGSGTELMKTDLIRVDPDGSTSVATNDLVFPNGIVLSADGKSMYVAETYSGRITAFDVDVGGGLSGRRVWAQFGDPRVPLEINAATELLPVLPDGLALDQEGALWIADAKGRGIARVAEGGEQLDFVETGALSVYAAALGGPEATTLYLCCAPPVLTSDHPSTRRSVLMSCDVDVPGVPRR
jgi:sugar lactone lactonase YvrE